MIKVLIAFVVIFFILVGMGVRESLKQAEKCESAGGVPLTERGTYKACMKPDNFIKLEK